MGNFEQVENQQSGANPGLQFQIGSSDQGYFTASGEGKALTYLPAVSVGDGNGSRNNDGQAPAQGARDGKEPLCSAWKLPKDFDSNPKGNDFADTKLGGKFERKTEASDSTDNPNRSKLKTGDFLTREHATTVLDMPSGEKLVHTGKDWSLRAADGKEIANNNDPVNGKLKDGAYVDHIVPTKGSGWSTINYPNGDKLSIKDDGSNVSIHRGDASDSFAAKSSTDERHARNFNTGSWCGRDLRSKVTI